MKLQVATFLSSLGVLFVYFLIYFYTLFLLCQDQIPPFPTHVAIKSIETQLGAPISQIFADISSKPIAAASLGQVYKG